jgi:glycyl-tRNA synthetase beta chain
MPDFLLEIGCEEIPARMLRAGADILVSNTIAALQQIYFPVDVTRCRSYWTPRRLTSYVPALPLQEPNIDYQEVGPSWNIAFKDGAPTAAAEAFAKKHGVPISSLIRTTTKKGNYAAVQLNRAGRPTGVVLREIVEDQLRNFYWPKTMYWRAKTAERFVRPVRWIVALLDDEVLPIEFGGVVASRISRGHRFLSSTPVEIRSANDYVDALKANAVLVVPADRASRIDEQARNLEVERKVSIRTDRELQSTVVNLTEWPSVILGNFDREFLELPDEVLVTVMRDHQKYFAVEDAGGKLLPHFLAVLNTDGDPRGIIRHGHERVLRARFNDARFFWQTDQKHSLRERTVWLKNVTFQKDLGSYYEKTRRVQRLCSWLCETLRQRGVQVRPGIVHKAASLAKTDLTTELVKEFTELQGIVGGLYAAVQELDTGMPDATRQAIAQAIYDQYKPESMDDSVPRSIEGAILSIADKADSIAGMFALGLQPTGSKDPFALRRQANGIVKTIAEKKLPLSLTQLFADAREAYRGSSAERKFSGEIDYAGTLRIFFRERLEFYLRDVLGFKYDVVNAVLAAGSDDVVGAIARAEAVTKVRPSTDFESISIAFKRIKNILRQAGESGKQVAPAIDANAFQEAAEKELAAQIPRAVETVDALRAQGDYEHALVEVSKLRPAVDRFFDKVMVMVDDERVRANRLALLQSLLKKFSTIADFSEIVTEGKESKESSKQ